MMGVISMAPSLGQSRIFAGLERRSREKSMRSIAHWGLVAVAVVLAGCQINPYGENQRIRFATWSDADLQPRAVRFPTVLTFPDETMYFYPIYDNPPRADLNLRAISCTTLGDGTLLLIARVQNMGADVVTNTTLGDFASFRVLATVTNANGLREDVSTAQVAPLPVASTVSLAVNPTRIPPPIHPHRRRRRPGPDRPRSHPGQQRPELARPNGSDGRAVQRTTLSPS
jgi:hypothetical protein